jgi:hypothetical protein
LSPSRVLDQRALIPAIVAVVENTTSEPLSAIAPYLSAPTPKY